MGRMLILSVSILTIFFASVSIAQLSNASDDKSNVSIDTDTCDSLSADSPSTNPISGVGHGAALNAEGEVIDVTPEFILEAQRYYLRNLFHQANEKQRSKLRKIQKRLLKGKKCDQQILVHVNSELIAWLINKVKPENASGLASINTFLRHEFATNFDDGSLEILEQDSLPTVLSATNLSGAAYIEECKAAGVPMPPDWRSQVDPKWDPKGLLTINFAGGVAEVFTFKPSSPPAGICFALPRSFGNTNTIGLLGIICQGSESSKACFWDNQRNDRGFPIEKNEAVPLANFAGGAELYGGTGGVCTDCHAGENAFIVHPGTLLDQGSILKPKNWHDPLVHRAWPQNPGPTTLKVNDIPDFDPKKDRSCNFCHNRPIDPDAIVGAFPKVSRELPGYCGTVLENAISTTMPPGSPGDASYSKHINALRAACDKGEGELPESDPNSPDCNECKSIKFGNSPAKSFMPCFNTSECPVNKTVTFTLKEAAEVFVRYDLGQSHGCCADHEVGILQILLDGNQKTTDEIKFVDYEHVVPGLEDFDYFFPPEVVKGSVQPVSQLDSALVGPRLMNYKLENRFSLGSLDAGRHTVELQVGDAGWNEIFEIYR